MDNLGYCSNEDNSEAACDTSRGPPPQFTGEAENGFPQNHNMSSAGEDDHITPGRCGLFCWKPNWLQRFPTKHWFVGVFLCALIVKGMAGSYLPATISSVEKRLKISTETIGYITSGNEISQIMFSLILSYIGGRGHRPRWMAFGILASAVSYFLYASPHFLYGPGNEALSYTAEYYSQFHPNATNLSDLKNVTKFSRELTSDLSASEVCQKKQQNVTEKIDCGLGDDSIVPLGLIFSSQFVAGVGSVLLYTLAGPFLDDHMKPQQAPIMIAVTGAFRQVGPLFGYIMAYVCLRFYVSPWLTPLITYKDEHWLGAWWLGSIVITCLMAIVSFLVVLFPRVLHTTKSKPKPKIQEIQLEMNDSKTELQITVNSTESTKRTEPVYQKAGKDLTFWASFVDLLKNKTNTWNNLSILFYGFAFSGFGTYFPKYLQTVIKRNASDAALTTGLSSIFFQVAGLLLSGFMISKFKLRARTLAGINAFVDVCIVLVVLSFSQLVCRQGTVVDTANIDMTTFYGSFSSNSSWTDDSRESSICFADCHCDNMQGTPVCYQDKNLVFYSACHAGCKEYDPVAKKYTNCSCLPSPDISLVPGKCVDKDSCYSTFVIFISLMAAIRFLASFGRIGNILIPYRCVDRSQKSLASGLSFAMFSIVSIPSPIMYGKIIDSTCLRWGTKCGERGNCVLYDDTKFAFVMSTTAAGLALLGMVCDVMVWYHVKDLKLYGDDEEESQVDNNNKTEEK